MEPEDLSGSAVLRWPESGLPEPGPVPDRQREALVLRFYLDLPDPEIARIMGIRPGTVRSATHRALKALGHLLESTL